MSSMSRRRQDPSNVRWTNSDGVNGVWENTMERENSESPGSEERADLRGDRRNIAILLLLYVLQGIPMGLAGALPMVMQTRGAEFSLVYWPFSLKLLWAPIVDSIFFSRFGRRKSWLIPSQLLIGFFMLFLSVKVDGWINDNGNDGSSEGPCVGFLTLMFFILNFLAATQDIAVDGWALTMLKRRNVGYASTCNSVGQSAGYFLGNVVFMALYSAEFSNRYLRYEPLPTGVVTLSDFLYYWGIIFLVTTILIAIFKRERSPRDPDHEPDPNLGLVRAYSVLWDISQLPSVKLFAVILLTAKIAFGPTDAVTSLKLLDAGIPKEHLAFLAVLMVPVQILFPVLISKYTTSTRPMNVYLTAIPYRLSFNIFLALFVYITPYLILNGNVPLYYYAMLLIVYAIHQVFLYMMFVSVMAFFVRISDPALGGTYMTLLNTICNLGTTWPTTVSLWLMDPLTSKSCSAPHLENNACSLPEDVKICKAAGGTCNVELDGYYIEVIVGTIVGFFWLWWSRRRILSLQSKDAHAWRVQHRRLIR